jgi:hypothetical protein
MSDLLDNAIPYEVWIKEYGKDYQHDAHVRRWRWFMTAATAGVEDDDLPEWALAYKK